MDAEGLTVSGDKSGHVVAQTSCANRVNRGGGVKREGGVSGVFFNFTLCQLNIEKTGDQNSSR